MIRRLLALDGVEHVARVRDDGALVESIGLLAGNDIARLCRMAHDLRRIAQGNADQLAMFTGMRGWTPPRGWIVRGPERAVCCVGNLICVVREGQGSWNDIVLEMSEVARW